MLLMLKNGTTFCLSSRHQLIVDSDAVVMEVVIVDQDRPVPVIQLDAVLTSWGRLISF